MTKAGTKRGFDVVRVYEPCLKAQARALLVLLGSATPDLGGADQEPLDLLCSPQLETGGDTENRHRANDAATEELTPNDNPAV
jgi:hypothetical protein